MSCDRRCFDVDSGWYDHDECRTCPGRDDGTGQTVKQAEELNALRDAATIRAALMRNPATNGLAALDKMATGIGAREVSVLVAWPKGVDRTYAYRGHHAVAFGVWMAAKEADHGIKG